MAFPATALLFAAWPTHILAHDWYLDLKAKDGASCCSKKDCHPVDHRYTDGKGLELQIGVAWILVDPDVVLSTSSPDDHAHACYFYGSKRNTDEKSWNYLKWETTGPVVRCVILPGSS
jgi:hypothetical protein